jgi:two-component system NtrC family sensor kinase
MLRLFLLLCCWLLVGSAWAQPASLPPAVSYSTLHAQGITLTKGWKWHAGDNPAWASRSLDDSQWPDINPTRAGDMVQLPAAGISWLRLRFRVSDSLRQQALLLLVNQSVASEIYLNGRLLHRYGTLSTQPSQVQAAGLNADPLALPLAPEGDQVLAIRMACWDEPTLFSGSAPMSLRHCTLTILNATQFIRYQKSQNALELPIAIGLGCCLLLTLLHLAFFGYNPGQRANLYFATYTFWLVLLLIVFLGTAKVQTPKASFELNLLFEFLSSTGLLWALRALYALFNRRLSLLYYGLWALALFSMALSHAQLVQSISLRTALIVLPWLLPILAQLWLTGQAVGQRKRGARIIASGFVVALVAVLVAVVGLQTAPFSLPRYAFVISFSLLILSPPLSISLFLAREFVLDSRLLQVKLRQVQQLSAQTIAQEQEKQHLLAHQNEQLEQQVVDRTAQLQQSLDHLQATQAQLVQKEKMASLGELTAGIAHEIQNPLNFVNNFSEVSAELLDELAEEQARPTRDAGLEAELVGDLKQNLQKITQHGQRAANIVRGMLEHSRVSTSARQPTNLNALADEYLRLAYHGLQAKYPTFNADLHTNFASALPPIEAVSQDVGRVLLNLFTNAFYAVRERQQQASPDYVPTVSVTTQQVGNQVIVCVKDNGTGIPQAIQQKIFHPFFTTKPTGEGTGLGLSLAHDIVVLGHGGQLTVESQEGVGAAFSVNLPVA